MRLRLLAAALALFALAPMPAHADPNPGDACANAGEFQRTGGAESAGVGNMMVCSGGTWKALIGFDGTANVALNYAVSLAGDLTPAQITANQNDYSPAGLATASTLLLSSDASRNITGIAGGADGRVLQIINTGSNPIVLVNQSTSLAAVNRLSVNANITLAAGQGLSLWYEAGATNRSRALTGVAAAAGGDREIQFNNAGAFGASSTSKLMSDGDLLLTGTFTGTSSAPTSGSGSRMFFDTQNSTLRAGWVSGTGEKSEFGPAPEMR